MFALTVTATLIVCIAVAYWLNRRRERNGEWQCTGAEMRRFANGHWEYREMTEDESNEWKDRSAW